MGHSKRCRENQKAVDETKTYTVDEAVELLLGTAPAKFDETVELAMRLGVDPKRPDQAMKLAAWVANSRSPRLA